MLFLKWNKEQQKYPKYKQLFWNDQTLFFVIGRRFRLNTLCAWKVIGKSRTGECHPGFKFPNRWVTFCTKSQIGHRWFNSDAEPGKGIVGSMRSDHAPYRRNRISIYPWGLFGVFISNFWPFPIPCWQAIV